MRTHTWGINPLSLVIVLVLVIDLLPFPITSTSTKEGKEYLARHQSTIPATATMRCGLRHGRHPDVRIVPIFLPAFEGVVERLAEIGEAFVVMDLSSFFDVELAPG